MVKSVQKQVENAIEIIGYELYLSTYKLSAAFGIDHISMKKLITKHKSEFLSFEDGQKELKKRLISGISNARNKFEKRGRKQVEFLLSEHQAMYLILLSKNNEQVVKFKGYVTRTFFKQRKFISKIIAQKQNAEWLEKRKSGAVTRRISTDVMQEFIGYANSQGSQSADKYYIVITKMEMRILFDFDYLQIKNANLRNFLNESQLSALEKADEIIERALKEGMKKDMFYKDIYKLAKDRVERFADLIGRSPVLSIVQDEPLQLK